jgi:hypothetical protein
MEVKIFYHVIAPAIFACIASSIYKFYWFKEKGLGITLITHLFKIKIFLVTASL